MNIVTLKYIHRKKYKSKKTRFFSSINIFFFFWFIILDTSKKKKKIKLEKYTFLAAVIDICVKPQKRITTVMDILRSCNSKMNKLKYLYTARIRRKRQI